MTDTLWQSFANVYAASQEANAVQAAIEQLIDEGALGSIRTSDDGWEYDSWPEEDDDWGVSYSVQTINIRPAGTRGAWPTVLSIALSFYRPEDRAGDDWAGGQRAKVYVGVAPVAMAWDLTSLLVDGSGVSDSAEPRSEFRWGRTDSQNAWFFCSALDGIDSRDALSREIMKPLAALLAGADDEIAFMGCRTAFRTPKVA